MAKYLPYYYGKTFGITPNDSQLQEWNDSVNIHSQSSFKSIINEYLTSLNELHSILANPKLSHDKRQYVKNLLSKEEPYIMQLYGKLSSFQAIFNLKAYNKQVAFAASPQYSSGLQNGTGAYVPVVSVHIYSLRTMRNSLIVFADFIQNRSHYIQGIKSVIDLAKDIIESIEEKYKANTIAAKERRKAELLAEVARLEAEIG